MAHPDSLDFFLEYARTQSDYKLEQPAAVAGSVREVPLEEPHGR
jgi:hypothetical protein